MTFLGTWHESAIAALGMFWTALWAFALGYLISSMIQVFVTQKQMQKFMGKDGCKAMFLGTFFGFISSSCSFAALSGARALFAKGAGLAPSLAFLLASTNLVIELGIVIAVFLTWEFVVAEYVGGLLLIFLMWMFVQATGKLAPIEEARTIAQQNDGGGCHDHCHGGGGGGGEGTGHQPHQHKSNKHEAESTEIADGKNSEQNSSDEEEGEQKENHDDHPHEHHQEQHEQGEHNVSSALEELTKKDNWKKVAMQYFMEWSMVWKDVTIGFTVAGIIAAFVPGEFYEWFFIGGDDPNFWQVLEHCIVGPAAVFVTFICSMGNIPLSAVLYSNGVSFAGIMAFIFSDLIVIPVVRVNAKYFGWKMALYIFVMFLTIIISSALILHYVFEAIGIIPPNDDVTALTEQDHFKLNYTFVLNVIFLVVSAFLFVWHFRMHGFQISMGSNKMEVALFWLALASYCWLIGGLFAGLAD